MRLRFPVYFAALVIALLNTAAFADEIILKNGTVYSGKFIRGDSKIIEFRVLGRVESFQKDDVSQIIFKEPEVESSAKASAKASGVARTRQESGAAEAKPALSRASAPTPAQPDSQAVEERPRLQTARQEPSVPESTASSLTIPAGMGITVRTATEIDTERNRVGDTFEAMLEDDLISGTQIAVSRGALLKGRIAYAKESGKLAGQSQLILELVEITANGKIYPIRTSDYTEVGSSRGTRTAQTVGGVAAVGAIIGAIAGGGKGAAIGAASGAAVGTGVQVITKGEVLRIPIETILEFKLQSPLVIDAP